VRQRLFGAAAAVSLSMALVGCAQGSDYSAAVAGALQRQVLAVAQSAKNQDYATALSRLSALQELNDHDLKAGKVSPERHDAISDSIVSVRADLTELQNKAEQEQLQQQLQQLQQQQQQQPPQDGDKHDKKKDHGGSKEDG
jgi:hypothetical protein